LGIWIERSLLLLVFLLFGFEAFHLERQNSQLRNDIARAADARLGAYTVSAGAKIPIVRGVDSSGRLVDLSTSERTVVLITVSTGCPTTVLNMPAWKRVVEKLNTSGIPVIWVGREGAEETVTFLKLHGVSGTVVGDVPHAVHVGLGLAVVPQTLVVKQHVVQASWLGRFELEAADDLVNRFYDSASRGRVQ
jgi:hypothetical protein